MLYCFDNNQGCLVLGTNIPKNISKLSCDSKSKRSCNWEDVGTFTLDEYGLVKLSNPFPCQQNNSKFIKTLYDEKLNQISSPKQNGIILHCFENKISCMLLGSQIPKNIHKLQPKKNHDKPCQWEDIGTFSIQNNIINYNTEITIEREKIDMYNYNLKKIYVESM